MIPRIEIRSATEADLGATARLAARLVHLHHAFDPLRFFVPDNVESGYEWWFGKELTRQEVVLLIATQGEAVVGYCYARLEERDWNQLLDACGAIHDIWVEEPYRRRGLAVQLAEAAIAELRAKGAPRVVLHTAAANEPAQKLFESLGFRRTMIELTRECDAPESGQTSGPAQARGQRRRT